MDRDFFHQLSFATVKTAHPERLAIPELQIPVPSSFSGADMEYAIVVMAICLLALVWLAKRHSKGEQLHDLGGAFRHTPRLSGAILLVLAASIVCFTYEEFHPANGELIHYWIAAPFFTSVNFFGGLIFLVMGKQADKLLNMRPNEVPNSPLQSLTFWSITGITVVACLLFQWWVMTHYRRTF